MKKSKKDKNIKKWKRRIKIIKITTKMLGVIFPIVVLGGIKVILNKIKD
ncbi:hypothetical protein KQI69_05025 [Eubacterium sp. MSJ-13]|nr:hypothetical protein [Eubacterium sp. MSJ-13]MBU5478562.1 hypothetical protein [Eubacterium sp. MSJ-13]